MTFNNDKLVKLYYFSNNIQLVLCFYYVSKSLVNIVFNNRENIKEDFVPHNGFHGWDFNTKSTFLMERLFLAVLWKWALCGRNNFISCGKIYTLLHSRG